MSTENPSDTQTTAPPLTSETSTSIPSLCLKSASDVGTSSNRPALKETSSASTLAKRKKKEKHDKEKSAPKKITHKPHSMSGVGKQKGSALPPLEWAQPNIVDPPAPELPVIPPVQLLGLPIQQLNPLVSEASIGTGPISVSLLEMGVETTLPDIFRTNCAASMGPSAAYALLFLPDVDFDAMDDA
ncbi:UNVERIFIED_CONTAM: hypothetical protein K2H54_045171 [Gekko kuhli]